MSANTTDQVVKTQAGVERAPDVLAVMDRGIADLMEGHCTPWTARDAKAMRAAVAELIEADKEYDAANAAGGMFAGWERFWAARERRAAALARVGGAA